MKINKNILVKYLDLCEKYNIGNRMDILKNEEFVNDDIFSNLICDENVFRYKLELLMSIIRFIDTSKLNSKKTMLLYNVDASKLNSRKTMLLLNYIDKYNNKICVKDYVHIMRNSSIIGKLFDYNYEQLVFNIDIVISLLEKIRLYGVTIQSSLLAELVDKIWSSNLKNKEDINKFIDIVISTINVDLDEFYEQYKTVVDIFNLDIFNEEIDSNKRDHYLQLFDNLSLENRVLLEKTPPELDFYNSRNKLRSILFLGIIFLIDDFYNDDEMFYYAVNAYERCPINLRDNLIEFYQNIIIESEDDKKFAKYIIVGICNGNGKGMTDYREVYNLLNYKGFRKLEYNDKIKLVNDITSHSSYNDLLRSIKEVKDQIDLDYGYERKAVAKLNKEDAISLKDFINNGFNKYIDYDIIDNDEKYKPMDKSDINEILTYFTDEQGEVDLNHLIYGITREKVKVKKKEK